MKKDFRSKKGRVEAEQKEKIVHGVGFNDNLHLGDEQFEQGGGALTAQTCTIAVHDVSEFQNKKAVSVTYSIGRRHEQLQ